MSYQSLFYWLVVADNARTFFTVFMIIFTIISAVSTIWFIIDRNGDDMSTGSGSAAERAKKWMWWAYPFMILFWALFVLTPSKKDALLIVAGGQTMQFLTTDKSAKEIPHELSNFLVTEIKNMAASAKVDLNIKDQKEKILDSAKKMTAKELMEKMKIDSTFAKVVLDKE
jgi:hypothetical protein